MAADKMFPGEIIGIRFDKPLADVPTVDITIRVSMTRSRAKIPRLGDQAILEVME